MLLMLCFAQELVAQKVTKEVGQDTVYVPQNHILLLSDTILVPSKDTVVVLPSDKDYKIKFNRDLKNQQFYDSLHVKSGNARWKAELYNNLITYRKASNNGDNIKPEEVFLEYEGLQINKIIVKRVNILAGDVNDTTVSAEDYIEKLMHTTHVYTREKVIRKNLIIEEGELIDANRMADNERILRSLNYIENAKILITRNDDQTADVIVITKDNFPIGGGFGFSNIQRFNVDINHRNILGMGQELRYRALYDAEHKPLVGSQFEYNLSNIANSQSSFHALVRETPINTEFTFGAQKAYLSPETKYAGGIDFQYLRDNYALGYVDTTLVYNFNQNNQNVWVGRSFLVSKEKRMNLVVAGRYYRRAYLDRPTVSLDTNQLFENMNLVLGNILFIKNRNIKTRFIKYLGTTEDIHVGYLFSLTGGYTWADLGDRLYAGAKIGYGHAFNKGGYVGFRVEYGSFFSGTDPGVGVFDFKTIFFTPLLKVGRSKLRMGGGIVYKNGINRYDFEWIDLGQEIDGINGGDARGRSKSAIALEAVYFSGLNYYGFRFAPFISADMGVLRTDNSVLYEGSTFTGFGAGIRVRNESLIVKTLELSFVFYPNSPWGRNKYKVNYESNEKDVIDDLKVGEPYIVNF